MQENPFYNSQMYQMNQGQNMTPIDRNPVNSYGQYQNINPINGSQGFDPAFRATSPEDKIVTPTHTVVVDSRSRDCHAWPTPSHYRIRLGDVFKNITSLELNAAMIPRSSYNVHEGNNEIYFSIGSTITNITVTNPGNNYTSAPTVTISAPVVSSGTQATATATISASTGRVTSINITNPGSGYSPISPPTIVISPPSPYGKNTDIATAVATIGTHYTATLRPGQYTIGGNPPSTATGLILEIQNAMNYAVSGTYDPASATPFQVRLVSQYPTIGSTTGTPEFYDTNSTRFNRIQIVNVTPSDWFILFCTDQLRKGSSAQNLLGFSMTDKASTTTLAASVIPAGSSIRADFDYDLLDDPKYVVLTFEATGALQRTNSIEESLNKKFATIIFDANYTDTIKDTTGTLVAVDGVQYLSGLVTKGTFWSPPGVTKALKGLEFDQKKIVFSPPQTFIDLEIKFTCFGSKSGGSDQLYNFQGREHLLIFQLKADDQASQQRS